jgi:hypothetical protein
MNTSVNCRPLLDVIEQCQDLRLYRHVQSRHRFVCDQHLRLTASARAMQMRWRWPPENS